MKVLLYFQNHEAIKTSGIGRARSHQMRALESAGVEITTKVGDDCDLVHINTIWKHSEGVLKRCKKQNLPIIVHGHSTHEDFRNSFNIWKAIEPKFDRQLDRMYKQADLIITPTPYSKRLIDSYGFGVKTVAISNGIDVKEYGYSQENVDKFCKKFSIEPNDKVVMGVGYLFERKGFHDFVEVAKSFPNVKFIWFGDLPWFLRSKTIKKSIKNKPDNLILPGYVSGDIIKGAYNRANLLFFPSYEETEGIVVLEALASKTPLLVRNIGVYDGWVKDGYNAYMGSNNDEFVDKINLIINTDKNTEMLENGYKVACDRDLSIIGQQIRQAYDGLLKDFNKK